MQKILIVEDNPEMRKVLTQIFEQIYEVYTAADGQEGLERASSLQPQMILKSSMRLITILTLGSMLVQSLILVVVTLCYVLLDKFLIPI